jgi:hypothetical protein
MSASPALSVQWPGAELAHGQWHGPDLHLRLATAPISPVCAPDGGGSWYARGITLVCRQARLQGPLADAVGRVNEADLRVDGQPWLSMPLGHSLEGRVSLQLALGNGSALLVEATGLRLGPADQGEPWAHLHC